jgi:hypothetical protein
MAITRATVRQAATVREATAGTMAFGVQALRDQLRETIGVVRRVLVQTRVRVLEGNTHYRDKVLSIFELETEAIREGKADAGLIIDYTVCPTRVPDQELWPARLGAGRPGRSAQGKR